MLRVLNPVAVVAFVLCYLPMIMTHIIPAMFAYIWITIAVGIFVGEFIRARWG